MANRRHPEALCEECPLFMEGEFVPSHGPDEAKIAIVGEAPGYNESKKGIPFTGQSGKLLDAVLQHHKIKREEIFLTNACLCREPNGENPTKAAISACHPRLISELQERKVGTVVTLGNVAAESVLGQTGITKLRIGPGRESRFLPGVRVVPTIHPAAALRASDSFPHIITDFGKINSNPPPWEAPTYQVVDDEQSAVQKLRDLSADGYNELVIDIEVGIEKDTSFDHPNQYDMLCIGICYAKGQVVVVGEEALKSEAVKWEIRELFQNSKLDTQNGKFDIAGLYGMCGALQTWFDTMLAHYLLDERPGIHDLGQMGIEFLGAPDWKHALDKYKKPGESYAVIPRDVLYKYNAYDCSVTWDLKELFQKQLADQSDDDVFYLKAGKMVRGWRLEKTLEFMVAAQNELMFVELNGIGVDPEYIEVLSERLQDEIGLFKIKMNLMLPYVPNDEGIPEQKNYDKNGGVNPASPLQVKKVFKDFGTFVQSTDADTCKLIIEMKGPTSPIGLFCTELLNHRKASKDYGTYVDGIRKRIYAGTTRVYPSFLLHGTTEGRLSCRNPNLQNIPRKSAIRRLFIPTNPDNVFVQTDYSQAELRILAWLAGDRYFTDIFNEGVRDVFDELSVVLFPQYPKETTDKEFFKEVRSKWVKPFVYGLAYGRTEHGIAGDIEVGLNLEQARDVMEKFFVVIPEIVQWQKDIQKLVANGGDLVTPFGRHRRFHLITKQNRDDIMRQALAFVPASTSSDVCLRAFTRVRPDLKGIGWVRNLVHDSILAECHREDAEEVKQIMEKHMIDSASELVDGYVTFAVDSKVGKSWGDV